jgi:hypothetical protein
VEDTDALMGVQAVNGKSWARVKRLFPTEKTSLLNGPELPKSHPLG